MGKMLAAAIGLLTMSTVASAETPSQWFVLKVGRVNVEPTNVDGGTWDQQNERKAGDGGCHLFGAVVGAVAGVPGAGMVTTFLCNSSPTGNQRERDPKAPD